MAGGRFLVDGVGWGGWAAGVLLLGWVLRTLRWVWWTPRSTERKLRAQGIDGTSYRFLFGDIRETKSKPMPFSHDIPPRVLPFHHQIVKTYGKVSMTWLGVSPRVIIADPLLIRDVLLNKSGHIGKPKLGPLGQLLTGGLLSYDGEKWAMHMKIINPAFHVEKLKVLLSAPLTLSLSCYAKISTIPTTLLLHLFLLDHHHRFLLLLLLLHHLLQYPQSSTS
ncbi:unnamed protein product [Spirodela intermedia]|uniref:Uncharacterized protein n=1 Tax=Spirodela intermedia TaxID=51605 RepID=A0A7I8KQ89_SPIIN|nr:unnamed protein product [Spirodela intermedia]